MSKTNRMNNPLDPTHFYHLYNRGNNSQNIFYRERNYRYFLEKYAAYMQDYLDTYAYCLLPNHFHLLVQVKDTHAILKKMQEDFTSINQKTWQQWDMKMNNFDFPFQGRLKISTILEMDLRLEAQIKIVNWAVSEKLRRWLMSYAKAINKQEEFSGSLFQKNFRRILVSDMDYFKHLVWYVHNNPVHHNIFHDLQNFKHSSYQSFLSQQPTKLQRQKVLDWFGGKTEFVNYHRDMTLNYKENDIKFWTE